MSPYPYYEVDVPIGNADGRHGVHVLIGPADSPGTAIRMARQVYDAATAACEAGLEIPSTRRYGWGARGHRAGWEPDWSAATAGCWNDPDGLVVSVGGLGPWTSRPCRPSVAPHS